jgi:copper transporter 1
MDMGPLFAGTGSLLWFDGWTPTSGGTTFAACLGLFLLAYFSRLLGAFRRGCDRAWAQRAAEVLAARYGTRLQRAFIADAESDEGEKLVASPASGFLVPRPHGLSYRSSAPFIAAHDVPRGILQGLQTGISLFIMLAVRVAVLASLHFLLIAGTGHDDEVHPARPCALPSD